MHPVLPEAEPSEVLSEAGYDQSRKSYVPLLPDGYSLAAGRPDGFIAELDLAQQ